MAYATHSRARYAGSVGRRATGTLLGIEEAHNKRQRGGKYTEHEQMKALAQDLANAGYIGVTPEVQREEQEERSRLQAMDEREREFHLATRVGQARVNARRADTWGRFKIALTAYLSAQTPFQVYWEKRHAE